MKVWITQHALKMGIYTIDAEIKKGGMVSDTKDRWGGGLYFKPHWHETEEAAKEQAEAMRLKKIASLERQIEKLKKLKF